MINKIQLPTVTSEDEVRHYYTEVTQHIGNFQLEQQSLGQHTFYRWQAQIKEEVQFSGLMNIPSVRLYFVTQTTKGMQIEIDGQPCIAQAGSHNVFFGNEPCLGKDFFHHTDNIEVITIAITAENFALMAEQYPEIFAPYYQQYQRGGNFILSPEKSFNTTRTMQTALAQLQQAHLLGKAARPYTHLKVQELFLLQLQQAEQQKQPTPRYCKTKIDTEKMNDVRQLITTHLESPLSIAELARAVGVNQKKLCYGFKEVFGTTIFGYLYEYKMQLAHQLLLTTDKSISEIAFACGYEYVSHFSTAFKKRFGYSPKQFDMGNRKIA